MRTLTTARCPWILLALVVATTSVGAAFLAVTESSKPSLESCRDLIFFAVLEGLYRDGVATADVEIILKKARNEKVEGYVHFIAGCPLCIPALNAFRCYRVRPEFDGWKGPADTLGTGLSESERKGLRSNDVLVRLETVKVLVDRWVGYRLRSKRLSSEEARHYERALADRREKAMAILKSQRAAGTTVFGGTNYCAICDGAYEPSTR